MTSSHPTPVTVPVVLRLAAALDRRSAPRLALAAPRRRPGPGPTDRHQLGPGGQAQRRYQTCYIAVAAAGKRADRIAARLLTEVVEPLMGGRRG